MENRRLCASSKRGMNVDFVINGYGYIPKEKLKAKKEINKHIDNKVRAIKLEIGDRFHIEEDDDLTLFNAQTYLILIYSLRVAAAVPINWSNNAFAALTSSTVIC